MTHPNQQSKNTNATTAAGTCAMGCPSQTKLALKEQLAKANAEFEASGGLVKEEPYLKPSAKKRNKKYAANENFRNQVIGLMKKHNANLGNINGCLKVVKAMRDFVVAPVDIGSFSNCTKSRHVAQQTTIVMAEQINCDWVQLNQKVNAADTVHNRQRNGQHG